MFGTVTYSNNNPRRYAAVPAIMGTLGTRGREVAREVRGGGGEDRVWEREEEGGSKGRVRKMGRKRVRVDVC